MPEPGSIALYKVELDLYIARRKRMHSVLDPHGIPAFHAPHMIDVLEWLADKGVTSATFTDGETTYAVSFVKRRPNTPPNKEMNHG